MTDIYGIIQELNADNGSNYKMDVLRKHADNELLKRVLKMTYDTVAFTYGVTLKNVDHPGFERESTNQRTLTEALDCVEKQFASRNVTGHEALDTLSDLLYGLSIEDRHVLHGVINRDLRINMGRSNINKVFKGLIVKPVYMRCGTFNNKSASKISYPALLQLKADGTYREFSVVDGDVTCRSRQGETYEYPVHADLLQDWPDGVYIGELTVMDERSGKPLDRATGNGLINSDNPPHEHIKLELWDYVTQEAYKAAENKIKGTVAYKDRLKQLGEIIDSTVGEGHYNIDIIETVGVSSAREALQQTSVWMEAGFEGGILKDNDAIFRDGTSPQQLKMKLEIDAEVRVTGFIEGTPGTKREATFGSMTFASDDGMIKGSCSGFTDTQLEDFNSRRTELTGQVFTIRFNDITKGRANEHYALSHPRFVEFRNDKDETDTLERVLESKEMAMCVGES